MEWSEFSALSKEMRKCTYRKYHMSGKDHYIYNYVIWAAPYKAYSII